MQKIQFLTFLTVLLICWSCNNNAPKENQTVDTSPTAEQASDQAPPSQEARTPQTYMALDAFWPAFQREVAAKDAVLLGPKIAFPLKGGQYLIGKAARAEGVSKEEFAANLDLIFDAEAKAIIASTAFSQLEKMALSIDQYEINGLDPNGYRLSVQYKDEDGESTIMYIFGKTPVGYKLIGLDFAG